MHPHDNTQFHIRHLGKGATHDPTTTTYPNVCGIFILG